MEKTHRQPMLLEGTMDLIIIIIIYRSEAKLPQVFQYGSLKSKAKNVNNSARSHNDVKNVL